MKYAALLTGLLFTTLPSGAQTIGKPVELALNWAMAAADDTTDHSTPADSVLALTDPAGWTKSWTLRIFGNQASYEDWSQGGDDSFSVTGSTLLSVKYNGSHFANTTRMNLKFGQARFFGKEIRKTDDLIKLSNKTDYFLSDPRYSAFLEVSFITQFSEGFRPGTDEVISDFMSPGYITESIGLSYQPNEYFSSQVGIGLKQTFVSIDELDLLYGLGEDEDIRSEGGLTLAVRYDRPFAGSFNYYGELNTFSNLLISLASTDIRFSNEVAAEINQTFTANIQLDFFFDNDITDDLQIKQVIAVGLNLMIF